MKAIILAAGHGTRLRPVTLTMPKPLVPVANKSLIAYAIDVLREAGLNHIGIVVNDLNSAIPQQLGDGSGLGVQLEYIVQTEQKGLAHAAALCRDFVGDEPFCMFLGDNIFQDHMSDWLRAFALVSPTCKMVRSSGWWRSQRKIHRRIWRLPVCISSASRFLMRLPILNPPSVTNWKSRTPFSISLPAAMRCSPIN
jgi:UTP-glucose-1-phosphate uridylyltransferase